MTDDTAANPPGAPQEAIFVEDTAAHWFQHFAVGAGAAAAGVLTAVASVQTVAASTAVNLVVGFGAEVTARLGMDIPPGLKVFTEIDGGSGRAGQMRWVRPSQYGSCSRRL